MSPAEGGGTSFTRITTAGAGTMGSQVAWQMAFHGKRVTVYDAIPAGLEKGKALHKEYAAHFVGGRGASPKQVDDTFARLSYTTDLAAAWPCTSQSKSGSRTSAR